MAPDAPDLPGKPDNPAPPHTKKYGQTAVILLLLAVFSLAVLSVGIGLTWFAAGPPR